MGCHSLENKKLEEFLLYILKKEKVDDSSLGSTEKPQHVLETQVCANCTARLVLHSTSRVGSEW